MPEYLSTAEAARYLRLDRKKVHALVAEGPLPAARSSGEWLLPAGVDGLGAALFLPDAGKDAGLVERR